MSSVVVMLGSESALPQPKQPSFFLEKDSKEKHCFSSKQESSSTYEKTITLLDARFSTTLETITLSQPIRDGDTLVSAGGSFELGFFSPGSSKGRYVGIWYVVTDKGILVLLDSTTNTTVWSSNNTSRTAGNNPTIQLLDSGNLIVKDGNINDLEKLLWRSFDYPCDTLLPEMKIGWDLVCGLDRNLTSWKSTKNPAQGEFSGGIDRRGLPQLLAKKGDKIKTRAGSWNDLHFTGWPWYVLNPLGNGQGLRWMDHTQSWEILHIAQSDECENFAYCGTYASCNGSKSPVCTCLKGFIPKSSKDRYSTDWSNGCVRGTPLSCNDGSGFLKYKEVKLPDTSSS
nr:g-type lectin s-receptor-like serine/threonine-protein kinase [Quercus suber]